MALMLLASSKRLRKIQLEDKSDIAGYHISLLKCASRDVSARCKCIYNTY